MIRLAGFEESKKLHNLLFSLYEMRELEELVVKETSEAAERTDHPQGKAVFSKWARESEDHRIDLEKIIGKLQGNTFCPQCSSCMGSLLDTSYSSKRMKQLLELPQDNLGMKELYAVAEMHLEIEGDAEARYEEMSNMTDDEEIRKTFMELSAAEKIHHDEARQLIEIVRKMLARVKG